MIAADCLSRSRRLSVWNAIDHGYPTRAAREKSKSFKLKAIAEALKSCDGVILATDCDREGQLIGKEILEHLRYRGPVRRALFPATMKAR